MPLVQSSAKTYQPIKGKIPSTVMEEIERYIAWAGVNLDDFLEQAALMIFKEDLEWKKQRKNHIRVEEKG
jgi:hypothetical protein